MSRALPAALGCSTKRGSASRFRARRVSSAYAEVVVVTGPALGILHRPILACIGG
ncbi:MAG: hypothetical protein ACLR4Z_19015 [Butyricicoccaceae bacterium]